MKKILKRIKIEKIGYGGIGLARRHDGKMILIKGGALPGSIVDLKIVKEKKDFVEAHIHKVLEVDSQFIDGKIFCPHFFVDFESLLSFDSLDIEPFKKGCGGCKRQLLTYPTQLSLKENIVWDAFEKIKKSSNKTQFFPILGSPQEKGYRNKIEFSFGKYITTDHMSLENPKPLKVLSHWSLGFHKQGEFSKIVDIDTCGLISSRANKVFEYVKKFLLKSGLPVYDQKTHQGFFRHLVIREGINTQQLLINLVVSDHNLKEKLNTKRNKLLEKLKKDQFLKKEVDTFLITYNNELGDTVKNPHIETKTFRGEGYIYEKLIFKNEIQEISISFRISPFSFFQTNTLGAQQLFHQAIKLLGNIQGDILDLYCGTGSIGLSFLKLGKGDKLLGIEILQEAIIDARYNAKINGLEHKVNFVAAPVEKVFLQNPELKNTLSNLELVIVDPPREGLHKNVINFIIQLKKEFDFKLLYISCNPITMKRDVELFLDHGFVLKILQPVDMFPQTHHIETIGILQ